MLAASAISPAGGDEANGYIHDAVSPRVSLVLKADIRTGFTGGMTGKLDRLDEALDKLG